MRRIASIVKETLPLSPALFTALCAGPARVPGATFDETGGGGSGGPLHDRDEILGAGKAVSAYLEAGSVSEALARASGEARRAAYSHFARTHLDSYYGRLARSLVGQ